MILHDTVYLHKTLQSFSLLIIYTVGDQISFLPPALLHTQYIYSPSLLDSSQPSPFTSHCPYIQSHHLIHTPVIASHSLPPSTSFPPPLPLSSANSFHQHPATQQVVVALHLGPTDLVWKSHSWSCTFDFEKIFCRMPLLTQPSPLSVLALGVYLLWKCLCVQKWVNVWDTTMVEKCSFNFWSLQEI